MLDGALVRVAFATRRPAGLSRVAAQNGVFCTNGCSSLGFRASAGGGVPGLGLLPGRLPGRLVMVSAGPLQLSLGLLARARRAARASPAAAIPAFQRRATRPGLAWRPGGPAAPQPRGPGPGRREPARPPAARWPRPARCRALAAPAAPAVDERGGRGGSWLLERVFHRTFAPGGPAPRLGLVECRVADAGAQGGQDRIVVRDAGDEGVQPAATAGVQIERAAASRRMARCGLSCCPATVARTSR